MAVSTSEAIPDRYIRGCDGDLEEARRRWDATLAWRREEGVDQILREPQPFFEHIKRHYYYSHEDLNPKRIVPVGPDHWLEK